MKLGAANFHKLPLPTNSRVRYVSSSCYLDLVFHHSVAALRSTPIGNVINSLLMICTFLDVRVVVTLPTLAAYDDLFEVAL